MTAAPVTPFGHGSGRFGIGITETGQVRLAVVIKIHDSMPRHIKNQVW